MPCISVPTAILGAGALSAGSNLIGGGLSAGAATSAANTQSAAALQAIGNIGTATQNAIGAQTGQLGNLQTTFDPYYNIGLGQFGALNNQIPGLTSNVVNPLNYNAMTATQAAFAPTYSPLTAVQGSIGATGIANPLNVTETTLNNTPYANPLTEIGQFQNPLSAATSVAYPTNLATLAQTPGYQFALQQGLQATQNSFAAQGLGTSGAAMKGAANYAEGLASTTYQQQFQNALNQNALLSGAAYNTGNLYGGTAYNAGQLNLGQAGLINTAANQTGQLNLNQANLLGTAANQAGYLNIGGAQLMGQSAYNANAQQLGLQQQQLAQNQQIANILYNPSSLGLQAGSSLGGYGTQLASNIGNLAVGGAGAQAQLLTGSAAAQAAGTVGSTNAITNALTGTAGAGSNTALLLALNQAGLFGGGGGNAFEDLAAGA